MRGLPIKDCKMGHPLGEKLVRKRNESKLSTADFRCGGGNDFYCGFTAGDTHTYSAQSSCACEMPTERSQSDDYPIISVSADGGG